MAVEMISDKAAMVKAGEVLTESGERRWKVGSWRGQGTCCEVYQVHLMGSEEVQVGICLS